MRCVAPTRSANSEVSAAPAMAPSVPPRAITPKRRAAAARSKRSAMKAQKMLTAKRLNTEVQTKKARAAAVDGAPRRTKKKATRLAAKKW